MLKKIFTYFSILAMIVINGCDEETEIAERDYPFLVTKIDNLNNDGVLLIGEILNHNQIDKYGVRRVGFLLFDGFDSGKELRIVKDIYDGNQEFAISLRTDIQKNQQYTVRAFMELSNGKYILGSQVLFTGQGSEPSPIEVSEMTPLRGTDHTRITFVGSNFGYNVDSIQIFIADQQILIDSSFNNVIYGRIPKDIPLGEHQLTIKSYGRERIINEKFEIRRPEIHSLNPSQGFDGTLVEINGKYLGSNETTTVFVNNLPCEIVAISDSSVSILTPETSFYDIAVLNISVGEKRSDDKNFTIQVQEIETVNPLISKVGGRIQVTGKYLTPNGYHPTVLVDGKISTTYDIEDESLKFIVPNITTGLHDISIQVGQKVMSFTDQLTIIDTWGNSYSAANHEIVYPLSCQIGDDVYYGFGNQSDELANTFFRYNISENTWTELSPIAGLDNQTVNWHQKHLVNIGEDIYVLLRVGFSDTQTLFKYNIEEDRWEDLGETGVREFHWTLAFENTIYGATLFGQGGTDPKMYKYDPGTNSWAYLYNLSFRPPLFAFILNNQVYISPADFYIKGRFGIFNIETGELTRKADFPGYISPYSARHLNQAMSLDGKGFLILEQRSSTTVELYEYDPELDIWIDLQALPGKREHIMAFQTNNEIHLGLGFNSTSWTNKIWKFQP